MNINPLKKEDNTEALVKALQDANSSNAVTPQNQPAPQPIGTTPPTGVATAPNQPAPTTSNPATPAFTIPDASTTPVNDSSDLPAGLSSDPSTPASSQTGNQHDIDTVKKSALEQLRPLIEKLDLEPADKFDKYLMMLRASDDPTLIKPAFEAAQGITGEEDKAKALLDIINEINYITANQEQK